MEKHIIEIEAENNSFKSRGAIVERFAEGLQKVSPYARFFDECSPEWSNDPEYNKMFLHSQQQFANEKLKSKGHLYLNEVYDMLGLPRSRSGAIVGWIYDPENNKAGDNFVDFGIYTVADPKFVNGYERSVLLDFNVDGLIIDHLKD